MISAYRCPFPKIVDRIIIEKDCGLNLPHSSNPEVQMIALWDTGATCTCISNTVAKQLGLVKVGERDLTVADNKTYTADVFCAKLRMGHIEIENMFVCGLPMDGKRENAIIGMDVISMGDLAITNFNGQSFLTFRVPSIERIDYVADIEMQKKCMNAHIVKVRKGISDKCECGSGKAYSNCHGQSVYAKYENGLLPDTSKLNKK